MKKYIIIPLLAFSFVFAGTAHAGFFDWFQNTPLNQEAAVISATKAREAEIVKQAIKAQASSVKPETVTEVKTPISYTFEKDIKYGNKGSEVIKLQEFLISSGYYSGNVDGKYGQSLQKAVKAFQNANGIKGNGKTFGSQTRAIVNNSNTTEKGGPILSNSCTQSTQPWLRIITPNGGETFSVGQTMTIKWVACNYTTNPIAKITLKLETLNASHTLQNPVTGNYYWAASDGATSITIPFVQAMQSSYGGQNFKIKGEFTAGVVNGQNVNGSFQDSSDNKFTINNMQPVCNLNQGISSTNPSSQNVLVGTNNFAFLTVKYSAMCNVSINRISVNVGGTITPNQTALTNFTLFDGQTQIASVQGSGDTITFGSLNYQIPANTAKHLTIKANVVGGAGLTAKLGVNTTRYTILSTGDVVDNTTFVGGNIMNIIGTNQTAVPPTFQWQTVASTTLTGNVNHLLGVLKITNPNTDVDVTFQNDDGNKIEFNLQQVADDSDFLAETIRFKDELGNTLDVGQFSGITENELIPLDFSSGNLVISPGAYKKIYIYADTSDFEDDNDSLQLWLDPQRLNSIQYGYSGSGNVGVYSNQIITGMPTNYAQIHVNPS